MHLRRCLMWFCLLLRTLLNRQAMRGCLEFTKRTTIIQRLHLRQLWRVGCGWCMCDVDCILDWLELVILELMIPLLF